jgi:hypothetical protein
MDNRVRESQIDRSWLQHDPAQGRVPREIYRNLRTFKRTIKPIADRIEAASEEHERIGSLMYDYGLKGAIGKQRALKRLRQHFELATLTFPRPGYFMWSWLQPRGSMLLDPKDEGESQNALLVRYGVAWLEHKRLAAYTAFSIEACDHALARLMQRAPGVNLPRVLEQAQDQLFAADAIVVNRHVASGVPIYLSAGPGLLICEAIRGCTSSGDRFAFARARTWIGNSTRKPDQMPIAPAADEALTMLNLMSGLVLRGPQPKDSAA